MMRACFKIALLTLLAISCKSAWSTTPTQWTGNIAFSMGHGLNYHLDGTPTSYWDESSSMYRINRSTSYTMMYQISKRLSFSCFYERFSGLYQDSVNLYTEELIFSRAGNNVGLLLSYHFNVSEKWSIAPRLGCIRRDGYELYAIAFIGIG